MLPFARGAVRLARPSFAALPLLIALAFAAGCGSDDDASAAERTPASQNDVAQGSPTGASGRAGAGGQAGRSGAGGTSGLADGGATAGGSPNAPTSTPPDDAGSEGAGNKGAAPPGYAGADAGFCNPTLVVMLPLSPDGGHDAVAKVQIHADTTASDLGTAKNRYGAICGESDGEDILIGLDVPETGNLTLALAASTPSFHGVLSLERGVCKGTLDASSACAAASEGGLVKLSVAVAKGEHLFVFVDTAAGQGGEFDLVATLVPTPLASIPAA